MSRYQKSNLEELKNYFKTRNKIREYPAHTSKVHSVGWSCDGRRLASGSFDKSVTIFTLDRDRMERVVVSNSEWVVVVPFWAVWPYETMVLPKQYTKRFTDMKEEQKEALADIIKQITIKYDNLFKVSFPYSMGWHGAPTGSRTDNDNSHWVFHGIYYPPLLRSASVKKFMVGFEMLAQNQRDLTAEQAAEILRRLPNTHFSQS